MRDETGSLLRIAARYRIKLPTVTYDVAFVQGRGSPAYRYWRRVLIG